MPNELTIETIEKSLTAEGFSSPDRPAWLDRSYRDPPGFWQEILQIQKNRFPWPPKSVPFRGYDFYHDIIGRNSGRSAPDSPPAFLWYDPGSGWQKITYADLGVQVEKRAAAWRRFGVQAGQTVCILHPLGIDFLVALLTALKLGLVLSVLPPEGRSFMEKRLENLAPDYLATDEILLTRLPAWQNRILPRTGSGEAAAPEKGNSFLYASGTVAARLFDPASETPHVPREVTSDALYLAPLRDGMIALGLSPGRTVAAPGFHFLETQPALLLAALLNGATFLHVEPEDIETSPELLIRYPLKAIGISPQVRDILLKTRLPAGSFWKFWFHNPAESGDLHTWTKFVSALQLEEVLTGNLVWNAAAGGCSLFSFRRPGQPYPFVLPSAGVPWQLRDMTFRDTESLLDFGILSLAVPGLPDEEPRIMPTLLARSHQEWLPAGAAVSGRSGRYYPRPEVLDVIDMLPLDVYFSIVENVSFSENTASFILLVFTGTSAKAEEATLGRQIRNHIIKEMGTEFVPDRIRFYPLVPRRNTEGGIDHTWCSSEFRNGGLHRKSRHPLYQSLSRLREYLYA